MTQTTWDVFSGKEPEVTPHQPVSSLPAQPLVDEDFTEEKEEQVIENDQSINEQFVIEEENFSFCKDLNSAAYHPVYAERSFDRLRMPRSPHWAIVWSDLMMTMFIFFAVLYIYQSGPKEVILGEGFGFADGSEVGSVAVDPRGGGLIGPSGEPSEPLEQLYILSRKTIMDGDLKDFARVDLAVDKTVRFVLTGDLLFDSGRADMKPQALQSLKKIMPLVSQTPYMINVVGHTDNVPIQTEEFPSNWELSLIRAGKVARFLMNESGLDEKRFYVTGHASFDPVADNDTPENRSANRRVEIILTREKPTASKPGENNEE